MDETKFDELLSEREKIKALEHDVNDRIVAEVTRLVDLGYSYRKIGLKMGVSAQRVHQLYHKSS